MPQTEASGFIGIQIHVAQFAIRAQIVDSTYMVVMDMRNKHTIYLAKMNGKNLLTEIWSAINQYTGVFDLKKSRRA